MITLTRRYDAVVVGGRPAGAATAMLLARGGLDVLVLEASRPGTDTLSTHALMRGAVVQLDRWGLLDDVVAAGTPAIGATEFHYGPQTETVTSAAPLWAPRRTVLDPIVARAAAAAGADVRFGARVTAVCRDARGAVIGVDYLDADRRPVRVHAPLVVGADGRRSTVADAVGAVDEHPGTAASTFLISYRTGFEPGRYRWFYGPGLTAGVIPTNDGRACVWAGAPSARFAEFRADLAGSFRMLMAQAAPELGPELAAGEADGPVRGFPGQRGHRRTAAGPGWALVGDAGYYKDPITAHGITDALRDAELLARAVLGSSHRHRLDALREYQDTRDRLSGPLAAITERLAGYAWDLPELRDLLPALSRAMRPEVEALRALDGIDPALDAPLTSLPHAA